MKNILKFGLAIAVAIAGAVYAGASEAAEPTTDVIAQASPAASPTATPPPPTYQYSATAEGSYVGAPQFPASHAYGALITRAFDSDPNTGTFNTLNLQGSKSSAGQIGWKVELNIGNDANGLAAWNSWQLTPTAGQVKGGAAACGGTVTAKSGPTLAPAIPFPPFNNAYTCLGNGSYYHTGGYDATQFYVQYATPNGAWTLTAGRMFTLVGYEVAESWNNAQFSRGLLWTFAEPITHTGVRLAYGGFPHVTITVGGNNGWDDIVGIAGAMQSLESQVAYTNGNLSASASFLYGPEQASYAADGGEGIGFACNVTITGALATPNTCGSAAVATSATASFPLLGPIGQRSLIDAVASYKFFNALTVAANYDGGMQQFGTGNTFLNGYSGARWSGVAGYVGYASPSGKWGLSGRYEYFLDPQGYRFGLVTTGLNLAAHEYTATGLYNVSPNVAARLEYRQDFINQVPFLATVNGGLVNHIGTMAADLVVHY